MTYSPGTVLVTGAARRLGRAVAQDLANQGWRICIHYLSGEDEAASLVEEIRRSGGHADRFRADLSQIGELAPLLDRCAEALGPVTCLINNAARFENDSIATLDPEGWQAHMDLNLRAPIFLTQAFAARLPAGARGNVINLVDQRVWRLAPDHFSYTLAKSALWTATRTLAQALAPAIRVNAIGPGPVLQSRHQTEAEFDHERKGTLLGRGAEAEDICRAVRFLLETPSITGQMILVDGGQHLASDGDR